MSEKLPPQNNDNNHEKDGRKDKIPAVIKKWQKRLAEATTEEDIIKAQEKIKIFQDTLDYDNDPTSFGNQNPVSPTESEPLTSKEDSLDTIEDYDTQVKTLKANIMQSDEARDIFTNKGELAYVEYVENAFNQINDEFGTDGPGKELQVQGLDTVNSDENVYSGDNEPLDPNEIIDAEVEWEDNSNAGEATRATETDAYGNPVQHEREWARPGTSGEAPQGPAFEPFGEISQNGSTPDNGEQLAIEAKKDAEYVLPEELQKRIKDAADNYAQITATDRKGSFFVGRYSKDPQSKVGEILHKIPGFAKLRGLAVDKMDKIGSGDYASHSQKIEQAKGNYELQIKLAKEHVDEQLKELGISEQEMLFRKQFLDIWSDYQLEERIVEHRHGERNDTNRLTEWWVSQDDAKFGKAKKIAVTALIAGGAAAVATLAVAAAPVSGVATVVAGTLGSGGLVGGAAGAGLGNFIGKSRANAKGYQVGEDGKFIRDAEGNKIKHDKTVAERQSAEDFQSKLDTHDAYVDEVKSGARNDEYQTTWDTEEVEERSTAEVKRNRERIKRAKAVGAVAGMAAGFTVSGLDQLINSSPKIEIPNGGSDAPAPKAEVPTPAPEATPRFNGESFTVESGNGYTQELKQFFQANGHDLTPQQSLDLHNSLVKEFGSNYIKDMGTYVDQSEVRLSAPKVRAEWVDGVAEFADKWRIGRGIK